MAVLSRWCGEQTNTLDCPYSPCLPSLVITTSDLATTLTPYQRRRDLLVLIKETAAVSSGECIVITVNQKVKVSVWRKTENIDHIQRYWRLVGLSRQHQTHARQNGYNEARLGAEVLGQLIHTFWGTQILVGKSFGFPSHWQPQVSLQGKKNCVLENRTASPYRFCVMVCIQRVGRANFWPVRVIGSKLRSGLWRAAMCDGNVGSVSAIVLKDRHADPSVHAARTFNTRRYGEGNQVYVCMCIYKRETEREQMQLSLILLLLLLLLLPSPLLPFTISNPEPSLITHHHFPLPLPFPLPPPLPISMTNTTYMVTLFLPFPFLSSIIITYFPHYLCVYVCVCVCVCVY